jgi:type IV pilus assembly protein PilA
MKSFLKSLKRQDGFTLVELMVVVAIIGLLSAVAIPNFKKYQAKSKTTEAKLQLSALYTAETAFFSDYNMYGGCLAYMGYNPATEVASRYYAVGFSDNKNIIAAAAVTAAQNSGLNTVVASGGCDVTATITAGAEFFPAGKGIGAAIIATVANMTANAAGAANGTCTNATATAGACVGTQADAANMAFSAAAVGTVSADFATPVLSSSFNINERKIISNVTTGY